MRDDLVRDDLVKDDLVRDDLVRDDVVRDDFLRENSYNSRPLFINPQDLASEPSVSSFRRNAGLTDAFSSILGSYSLVS